MRVLLADLESRVRYAMRALLERQPGVTVVGQAADASELLAQAALLQPDLILLDWRLHETASGDLLPDLRSACPGLRVIALGQWPDAQGPALQAGADRFVSKADPPDRLLAAVRALQQVERRPLSTQAP